MIIQVLDVCGKGMRINICDFLFLLFQIEGMILQVRGVHHSIVCKHCSIGYCLFEDFS